jgi:hypothetical protein
MAAEMKRLLDERAKQDTKYFPQTPVAPQDPKKK